MILVVELYKLQMMTMEQVGLWSAIYLEDVAAGSHVVKVYGYSSTSTGDYVLTIHAYQDPVTITDLVCIGWHKSRLFTVESIESCFWWCYGCQ